MGDDEFKRWKWSVLPDGPATMDKLFEKRDDPRTKAALEAMLESMERGPLTRDEDGERPLLRNNPEAIRMVRDMLQEAGIEVPPWTDPPEGPRE